MGGSQGADGAAGGKRRALVLAREATIVGLVGNPRPRSRTYQMVSAVADAFAAASGGRVEAMIDLVELKAWLFDYGAPQVAPALERVLGADVLVVGSPVYKATYTGLLKAFCDHIIQGQLAGIPDQLADAWIRVVRRNDDELERSELGRLLASEPLEARGRVVPEFGSK